jgi:ribosome-associated protein
MERSVVQASVEKRQLEPGQIARLAVEVASDKKATDIVLLDIQGVSVIADYFVICTGANPRQIRAIASAIDEKLSEHGLPTLHREGIADTGWLLLDYGDVIVHIFSPKERDYYRLERLWSKAKTVVYLQ